MVEDVCPVTSCDDISGRDVDLLQIAMSASLEYTYLF